MKKLLIIMAVFSLLLVGCGTKSTKTDWDYIQSKGEMIIGFTYYAPMGYLDETGKLIGFDVEFAEAVCEKLGVKPKFQVIDWEAKENELKAYNIDAVWNGLTATVERAKNMDLSSNYLINRNVAIVRAGEVELYKTADDLKGKRVIAGKGTPSEEFALNDPFFSKAEFAAIDVQGKIFMELAAGTADIGIGDYVMAMVSTGEGTDFKNLTISPYWKAGDEEYAIAFRKGSPETLEKINNVIEEFKADGTLEKIAAKYKLSDLLIK